MFLASFFSMMSFFARADRMVNRSGVVANELDEFFIAVRMRPRQVFLTPITVKWGRLHYPTSQFANVLASKYNRSPWS